MRKTAVYVIHYSTDAPEAVFERYERLGEIETSTQLTTWLREVAIQFCERLKKDNS